MDYEEYLQQYVSYDPILTRRFWAALLDYVTYFILVTIYTYFFGTVQQWGIQDGGFSANISPPIIPTVLIWLIYFPFIESRLGYTLGKGLFDIKVVRERKSDSPFFVSLKRHLLDPVDFFFFGFVAVLLVKFTMKHKRLGEFWAHSLVVKESEPTMLSQPPAANSGGNDAHTLG